MSKVSLEPMVIQGWMAVMVCLVALEKLVKLV